MREQDKAYCPTCQRETTLLMVEEDPNTKTMEAAPKKCGKCGRKFSWDGYPKAL